MGRLFFLFFLLPWWAYVPASIGVLWVGERVYEQALVTEAEKAAALETAAPDPVDLATFDSDRDIHTAREVHVVGLIDHELDYELIASTNGVVTSTRYLYMIFGADEFGSSVVRAALMLDKREDAQFLDTKADEWAVEATDDYWVYTFNGVATRSTKLDDMADEAIADEGLTKAADFIFIEPFFEGREAALAPQGVPDQTRTIGWAIAAFVALIGVVKRVRSVRARGSESDQDQVDLTGGEGAAAGVPEEMSDQPSYGQFACRAPGQPQMLEEPPIYTGYRTLAPELDEIDEELDGSDAAFELENEGTEDAYDDDFAGADGYNGDDWVDAEPAQVAAFESDAAPEASAASRFPPIPGDLLAAEIPSQPQTQPQPQPQMQPKRSSAAAFYAKLVLAMVLVGVLAYDPSLLNTTLPIAGIALFWIGAYTVFRGLRGGRRTTAGDGDRVPRHARRPNDAGQAMAAGASGS